MHNFYTLGIIVTLLEVKYVYFSPETGTLEQDDDAQNISTVGFLLMVQNVVHISKVFSPQFSLPGETEDYFIHYIFRYTSDKSNWFLLLYLYELQMISIPSKASHVEFCRLKGN